MSKVVQDIIETVPPLIRPKSRNRARKGTYVKSLVAHLMGGGCQFCGYQDYIGALNFHHTQEIIGDETSAVCTDASCDDDDDGDDGDAPITEEPRWAKKELSLDCEKLRNCWSEEEWPKLAAELQKCVMVCFNHHQEVHSGWRHVPVNYNRLDDRYLSFDSVKDLHRSYCLGCLETVSPWQSYCPSCKPKVSRTLLLPVEDQLEDLIFELLKMNLSIYQVSGILNVSHVWTIWTITHPKNHGRANRSGLKFIDFHAMKENNLRRIVVEDANGDWLIRDKGNGKKTVVTKFLRNTPR